MDQSEIGAWFGLDLCASFHVLANQILFASLGLAAQGN